MKLDLKTDERDGCVATISGCGAGGHTATFRFLSPEYAPDPVSFDGDSVSFSRDVLHGSVIASVMGDESGELRATLDAYSPDTDEPRKASRRAKNPPPASGDEPAGAVTAGEEE